MKNALLIFSTLCLLAIDSYSQSYIPFPDSNAEWESVWYEPYPIIYSKLLTYTISGDTIINELHYNKLMRAWINAACSKDTISYEYWGSFRNDTVERQVFFIPAYWQNEVLLYDFSLNVGDTIPDTYQNELYPELVVEAIDTVLVEGISRTRFTYWNIPDPLNLHFYVYEGIGSDWGLLEEYSIIENTYYLRCFHHNDSLEYMAPADTTCVLETDTCFYTGINNLSKSNLPEFNVYSTTEGVLVHLDSDLNNLSLRVFDMLNRELFYTKINTNSFVLNKQLFKSGIYFFQLTDNHSIIQTKKVLIF